MKSLLLVCLCWFPLEICPLARQGSSLGAGQSQEPQTRGGQTDQLRRGAGGENKGAQKKKNPKEELSPREQAVALGKGERGGWGWGPECGLGHGAGPHLHL